MTKHVLALALCLGAFASLSQVAMVKGYIITEKGDTLKGEAKPNKQEVDNYNKVTFKDANGVQKLYKPARLKGYGINDEHYVSMDSDGEKKFYKVITTGEINFYKLGFESLRMNAEVFEVEYYIRKSGEQNLVLVKASKFKKQVSDWMKDNPEFLEAYGEEKKFDPEKAQSLITNYNSWKAGNTQ